MSTETTQNTERAALTLALRALQRCSPNCTADHAWKPDGWRAQRAEAISACAEALASQGNALPAAGQEPVARVNDDGFIVETGLLLAPGMKLYAAPQPAVAAGWMEERENLRKALQFYADGEHFIKSDDSAWDTVSGEPQNYWCDEAGTATVEDGSIARLALEGRPIHFEDDNSALPPAPSTEGESNG